MFRPRILLSFVVFILTLSGRLFAATNPNIVLITLSSVRADRVGFLDPKHPTPGLDTLAKQSIVFERAYAQAPLTIVSDATILSGTYPQTHGATELGVPLGADVPWLADILRGRGYRTAAFVGSSALDPKKGFASGFDRGFETYDSSGGAAQIVHALAWLTGKQDAPFFLWMNIASSGNTADAATAKVLDSLREKKLFEGAILVLTADHGESLGTHGEDGHGIFLYDETIRIPLLVKLPQNQLSGKRVTARVRALDIAPTLLEAAGIPVPPQMQGQSLLRLAKSATASDLPVYAGTEFPRQGFGWSSLESWRSGKYLYVRAPKPELYDLSADPSATHNLTETSKAIAQTLAAQLDGFDAHFSHDKTAGAQLSSSEMQKLASLGYVGMQKSAAGGTVQGKDPKDVIVIANQTLAAMANLERGKLDVAIAALQQAIAKQPDTYLAQYGLGKALAQKQQYKEAIEHLHKAIALQPDSSWANFEIGRALMKTGDFKTAAVHLEIAGNRMAKFPEVHVLLAQAYDQLGRKSDAERERAKSPMKNN
jgi:arylsulfatase A-like enzyme/Tfp pilus assembly protein PilF